MDLHGSRLQFCLASCSAAAAGLPMEREIYVPEGCACEDPPKAVVQDFAGGMERVRAHGEGCAGTIAAQGGDRVTWRIDGAPRQAGPAAARAYAESDEIRVLSRERFQVMRAIPRPRRWTR